MKPISFTRRQFICQSGRASMALAALWSTPQPAPGAIEPFIPIELAARQARVQGNIL
jgi:hypothetical protein